MPTNSTTEERDVDTDCLSGCAVAPVLRDVSEMLEPTPVSVPGDRTAGVDVVSRNPYVERIAASSRRWTECQRVVALHEPVAVAGGGGSRRVD